MDSAAPLPERHVESSLPSYALTAPFPRYTAIRASPYIQIPSYQRKFSSTTDSPICLCEILLANVNCPKCPNGTAGPAPAAVPCAAAAPGGPLGHLGRSLTSRTPELKPIQIK